MIMKRHFVFLPLLFILFSFFIVPENGKGSYVNNRYKVNFTTKDGMLNGKYSSYYLNGVKRAEGQYVLICDRGFGRFGILVENFW